MVGASGRWWMVGVWWAIGVVLAAVAWDSFSFLGLCISFVWVTNIFYSLIKHAKTEVSAVLKNAENYKEHQI